jgi:hypothetical protein
VVYSAIFILKSPFLLQEFFGISYGVFFSRVSFCVAARRNVFPARYELNIYVLLSTHRVRLCVPYGSHNKQTVSLNNINLLGFVAET